MQAESLDQTLPHPTSAQILVAEDEAPIRMIWDRFLKRWGYQADLVENGQKALEMARTKSYQLVITDLTMPILTGQELVHQLKAEQPNLEIIVTTGQATIEVAVEMMKAGAYDFITKPISFNRAEFIIKKCLERVQAQQDNLRLIQKNRTLEELNLIKEKFIAITSHELRTPVSIINNIVDMLLPDFKGREEEQMLLMVHRSAHHLSEIVSQMHEVSSLTTQKTPLNLESVDIKELCQDVVQELGLPIQERNLRVDVTLPDHFTLRVDRIKFKKVARELLHNAIKFTPNGGTITLGGNNTDQQSAFFVRDTGIGIPQTEIQKIFQLFYEVGNSMYHHSSKEDFLGGGMGIGLSIVKEIVEAHHGQIQVESQEGQGSTFTVLLPHA